MEDAEGWLAMLSFCFLPLRTHQSTCAGNNRWLQTHKYFKRVLAVNSILEKDFLRTGGRAAQIYVLKFSRIKSALDQPERFSAPLSLSLQRQTNITGREICDSARRSMAAVGADGHNAIIFVHQRTPRPFNASIMINSLPQVMEIGAGKWKKKRGKV